MQDFDGSRAYSASDLVGFAACEHLTQLELAAVRGEITRPHRHDPFLEMLVQRGEHHELALLDAYAGAETAERVARGRRDSLSDTEVAAAHTIDLMRRGIATIYQATFLHMGWVGYADFLERVETPSDLGPWSYEVMDAKLARSVRASAIVQLCDYAEHVTRIQGVAPRYVHVVTGDNLRHTFRLADFAAYHRTLKQRFTDVVMRTKLETYPDPVEHCRVCRWWAECRDRRRTDDHLSLVAFIRRDQTRQLINNGVATRTALANAVANTAPAGMSPQTFERLRLQARLQVRADGCTPPLFELIDRIPDVTDERMGFGALPAPSAGDLFIDFEGDPYATDGGLWYLFGVVEVVSGAAVYRPYWAHSRVDERDAFRALVELIMERRRQYPDMHVYHYAPAEQTALKHLMGLHGVCEDDIDSLLRDQVLVDLYRVTRQAVRCSTESYSLKEVEKLYLARPSESSLPAGAIIAYEEWIADARAEILDDIARYNRADCESLIGLQSWLEQRRAEAEQQFGTIPRPATPELPEIDPNENAELAEALLGRLPDGFEYVPPSSSDVEVRASPGETSSDPKRAAEIGEYLLAHLLEWHRREAKPAWWWYFARRDTYEEQDFVHDRDTIGGLELVEELPRVGRSAAYRMRFEPQDHKFSAGSQPINPADESSAGTIVEVDDNQLELRRAWNRRDEPLPTALIPGTPIGTVDHRLALAEVARSVLEQGIDGDGPFRAVRDLLLRTPPRLRGKAPGSKLREPGEPTIDAAQRLVFALDDSYLAVQGPPGAGKTWTGARVIARLISAGKRVGITATTHNAIRNLLEEVAKVCREDNVDLKALQKTKDGTPAGVQPVPDAATAERMILNHDVNVAAGTSWLWARHGLRGSIDFLFVDEAGQMSFADVIAVGTAARNVVLLGDPQQLAQVSQGVHPPGAGASALEHVLGEHETVPDELGLFLDQTWRMHPSICRFNSEVAYDARLGSVPECERQAVDGGSGLWFVPVIHTDDATRSEAEAQQVADLYNALVGTAWTNDKNVTRKLAVDDLLVVAPYNAHVAELRRHLPDDARIGTVDKFQGQEGAVAIYSMASSSVDDAPRGLGFLYDLHRLNVATSRARARAYIVASPELLRAHCRSPMQIRLANALCRYAELAQRSG